jgi:hypothetical protein
MTTRSGGAHFVRAYQAGMSRVRDGAARHAQAVWEQVPGIDERYVDGFAEEATTALAPYRRTAVDLASGMVSTLLDDMPEGDWATADEGDPEVWRQPFISVWQALGSGRPYAEALLAGFLRAAAVGKDEVTGAGRATMRSLADDRITGWRRALTVPACDWCTEVAGQVYRSAESADFGHEGCHCEPVPIIGAE